MQDILCVEYSALLPPSRKKYQCQILVTKTPGEAQCISSIFFNKHHQYTGRLDVTLDFLLMKPPRVSSFCFRLPANPSVVPLSDRHVLHITFSITAPCHYRNPFVRDRLSPVS